MPTTWDTDQQIKKKSKWCMIWFGYKYVVKVMCHIAYVIYHLIKFFECFRSRYVIGHLFFYKLCLLEMNWLYLKNSWYFCCQTIMTHMISVALTTRMLTAWHG